MIRFLVLALPVVIVAVPAGSARGTDVLVPSLSSDWAFQLGRADDLLEQGHAVMAAEVYMRAATDGAGFLHRVREDAAAATGPTEHARYISVSEYAWNRLSTLRGDALSAYRERYEREAEVLYRRAIEAYDRSGDEALYRRVATAYFMTRFGDDAQERIADLEFERGRFRRAIGGWIRIAEAHPEAGGDRARYYLRILSAYRMVGDPEGFERVRAAMNERIRAGEITVDASSVEALERAAPVAPRSVPPGVFHLWGAGRADHLVASISTGGDRLSLVWKCPYWSDKVGTGLDRLRPSPWVGGGLVRARFTRPGYPFLAGFRGDSVYMAGVDSVFRIERPHGRILDRYPYPPALDRHGYEEEGESLIGCVAIASGVLIAPFVYDVTTADSYLGYDIKVPIARRGLVAFDTGTGKILWHTADHPRLRRMSFPAPPLVVGGVAYAAGWEMVGYVNASLVAVDLRTGRLLWRTFICGNQIELTMFGEPGREPFPAALAQDEGILYLSTSLGAIAAVDLDTGHLLWITSYPTIPVRASEGHAPVLRRILWADNPLVLAGGTLYVAPRDSYRFYALSRSDGRILSMRVNSDDLRHFLGIHGDELYFTSDQPAEGSVHSLRAGGSGAWIRVVRIRDGIVGRGQLTTRGILLCTRKGLVLVPYGRGQEPRFVLDSASMEDWNPGMDPGNVEIPVHPSGEGLVFVTSRKSIACYRFRTDRKEP